MAQIGRTFIQYYPILRAGLVVLDILTAANIVMKAITQGISSVTVGEWAELALITTTAFLGGKVARRVAKSLISRALKIPAGTLRSFRGFAGFVKSKGILLEADDVIMYSKSGRRVFGEFDLVGKGLNPKPVITLYKGGHNVSTLIHEFVHYCQWKYFVGGTRYDWQNFAHIGNYAKHLEDIVI